MKTIIAYLIAAISVVVVCYLVFRGPTVVTTPGINTVTTITQYRDTIVYKDKIKEHYVAVIDSSTIKTLRDSLLVLDNFITTLVDSLNAGKVYTLYDTTKFYTNDSLITSAEFWPLNTIRYKFFPRADTMRVTTVIPEPWLTARVVGKVLWQGMYVDASVVGPQLRYGIRPGFTFGINYKGDKLYGIMLEREFVIQKPRMPKLW